jgi:hypothetical protein
MDHRQLNWIANYIWGIADDACTTYTSGASIAT